MKDDDKEFEEKLKNIDGDKLAAAFADIFTDSLKQAAKNIAEIDSDDLEEDVKQVALFLSRQKNGEALLSLAGSLKNADDLKKNGDLFADFFEAIATKEVII